MKKQTIALRNCRFEILADGRNFTGLGRIFIGDTAVRSGRLPLRVATQTFTGLELAALRLLKVEAGRDRARVRLEALFRRLPVKLMRDHSMEPIHELGDWDRDAVAGKGRLDLVIEPSRDTFNGVPFEGFSYHWEYRSGEVPLFYLMDLASWELGGNITGATAYSQSSCSAPVVKFDRRNSWTTEGVLFFLVEQGNQNPIMTHNLPRWASHGSFDFQFKGNQTLIGVFERCELIRSVLVRDAGRAELKTFDKHIFDQTLKHATVGKKILLNRQPKSGTDQQNLWTWIFDEVDARARAEFGLKEEPTVPQLAQNFWTNFSVDAYRKDLLPAAINIGCKRIFVDNLKKSDLTMGRNSVSRGNMCCGHEYEIADVLGGTARVKDFVDDCRKRGIQVMCWTNNDQSLSSPLNDTERDAKRWYVLCEDSRQKWGGAYAAVMSVLDFGVAAVRQYFVDTHVRIHRQTGLHFFFDSFYNLAFMPVNYRDMHPRTIWRGTVKAFKALQDAGIRLQMESFGPWAQPQHGHPSSYNLKNIFACYKVGIGNDYTTVPTAEKLKDLNPRGADGLFYTLAHRACLVLPLHIDGKRVDEVWTAAHRQALADYHACMDGMNRRYLQEDGLAVLWHDTARKRATLWNFKERPLALPGRVRDLTAKANLPKADRYRLQAGHVYIISGTPLPTSL